MDVKLEYIKNTQPRYLEMGDIAYIINEIENLRKDRDDARFNQKYSAEALLIYADGNKVDVNLRRFGWKIGGELPPYLRFAIRPSPISFNADYSSEATVATYHFRLFKLENLRPWDNLPIYKEVFQP